MKRHGAGTSVEARVSSRLLENIPQMGRFNQPAAVTSMESGQRKSRRGALSGLTTALISERLEAVSDSRADEPGVDIDIGGNGTAID